MSKHLRRAAAATALAATLGGLVGLPSAGAAISTQAFCTNVQSGQSGFDDIGAVAPAQRSDIECLKASGITSGTTATTYSPSAGVARGPMATFVANLVDTANALETTTLAALPPSPPDSFTDDEGNIHESNIDQLAAADIVQGKTATTFAPADPVNRAQMATFIVEALEYLRNEPLPTGADAFTDDAGSVHESNINKLSGIDVVDGVGGSAYSPNTTVSRAQMASFLTRSLAWLHSQGQIAVLTPSKQSIVLTPSGLVVNETDSADGDEVAFTASNITVSDVDVVLVPCENVFDSGGAIGFVDSSPNDGAADPGADLVEADIVAVNGTAQGANTEAVTGVAVSNGAITFTVDSPTPDCVAAVVFDDADDDDRIDLDAGDRPSERFGTTAIQFVPPPATSGPMDENVLFNDEANNRFSGCEITMATPEVVSTTDCFTFTYDSNDLFFVDANANGSGDNGEGVALAAFETALSTGDDVHGTYEPGGQSSFVLTDEAPGTVGGVSVATVDGDTLTVTFDELAGADGYRVYRRADTSEIFLACPSFSTTGGSAYTLAGTVPGGAADGDAGTTNTFTDNGLSASTRYCYVVTAVDEGDEGGPSAAADGVTSADTIPPLAKDTELTINTSGPVLDTGDVIQICFDQDIADPGDGTPIIAPNDEVLTVRGANGNEATLTNDDNATYRFPQEPILVGAQGSPTCASSRTLEVVLGATPASTITLPATIIGAANIEDTSGTQFQPGAAGQEVVIDEEAGAEPN